MSAGAGKERMQEKCSLLGLWVGDEASVMSGVKLWPGAVWSPGVI